MNVDAVYTADQLPEVKHLVLFLTLIYVPFWFACNIAADVAVNDHALINH